MTGSERDEGSSPSSVPNTAHRQRAHDQTASGHRASDVIELISAELRLGDPGALPLLTRLRSGATNVGDPAAVVVVAKGTAVPSAKVGLLVVSADAQLDEAQAGAVVAVSDARLAFSLLSRLFDDRPAVASGTAASAEVHPDATVAADAHLAPGCVIGAGAVVGAGCQVGANSVVAEGVVVGDGTVLHPNVTLYPGVRLGERVVVHSGTVIGADGFGYAPGPNGAEKIHHLGGVLIGDDVEIGANSCIDRGTLDDTVIGARSKVDNHCQIGHNVTIGTDTLIAGMTGVAGSVTIGSGVILGGYVAVSDHVTIHDGARVAGRSGVTKSVPAGQTWAGFPAKPHREFARQLYLLGRLEAIWATVRPSIRAREDSE